MAGFLEVAVATLPGEEYCWNSMGALLPSCSPAEGPLEPTATEGKATADASTDGEFVARDIAIALDPSAAAGHTAVVIPGIVAAKWLTVVADNHQTMGFARDIAQAASQR